MNSLPRLKFVMLAIVAAAIVLAVYYYLCSDARQERLLHDSQAIETMLSERDGPVL